MRFVVLPQVSAARNSLEAQLSSSRAEVTALTTQLAELRGSLTAARDNAVAAELTATRLQEERVRLSKVCAAAMHAPSTTSLLASCGRWFCGWGSKLGTDDCCATRVHAAVSDNLRSMLYAWGA
jgi:hypothetical protein